MTLSRPLLALALALLASFTLSAHALPNRAKDDVHPRLELDCANFDHQEDGNWKGKEYAVVVLKSSKFDFSGTVFRPGEYVIDGKDMKSRLDAQCIDKDKQVRQKN